MLPTVFNLDKVHVNDFWWDGCVWLYDFFYSKKPLKYLSVMQWKIESEK